LIALINVPVHRKRGTGRKIPDDLNSSVSRTVVTDDQLVRTAILRKNTFQLVYEKALTIICEQRD
jgi:hypothetical protein